MVSTIFVAVDSDPGSDQWAADLLGELLGRPAMDVRLLNVHGESMALGTTQRLMWDQAGGSRLLVGRWTLDQWQEWFAERSIDLVLTPSPLVTSRIVTSRIVRAGDLSPTVQSGGLAVEVLAAHRRASDAVAAVLDWTAKRAVDRNGLIGDEDLDGWIDQLDQDPQF